MADVLMEAKEKICRLCLNFEDKNFTKLEASTIGKIKATVPELTVRFSGDSLICSKCRNLIDKAFELKRTFSKNNELIENERQKQKSNSIDLTSVVKNASSGENICRICLQRNEGKYVSLTDNVDEQFNKVLNYCIPELDKNVTTKPTVCSLCNAQLSEMYDFKKDCVSVQERIQSCYDSAVPEDIDLNRVLVLSRAEDEIDFLLGFEVQDEEGTDIFDVIPVSDEESRKRTNSGSAGDESQSKKPKLMAGGTSQSATNATPKSAANATLKSAANDEELPSFEFNTNLFYDPHKADMTVEDWLVQVEQCKKKFGWSDYTTIHKVLVKLKGINELYIWFSNIADIMDWEQWKKKLLRAFPLKNDYNILIKRMKARKKLKDETYVSYYTDKLKVLEPLKLTDEQKISCIFGGIQDILICCVGRVGYQTAEELLDYFKSCDDKKSIEAAAEAKKGNNTRKPTALPKARGKQSKRTVLYKVANSGVSMTRKKCTDCNRYGHTVMECRKYKIGAHLDKVQNKVVTDDPKLMTPRAKRIRKHNKVQQNCCSGCGKQGHLQAQCPQNKSPIVNPPGTKRKRQRDVNRAQEFNARKRREAGLQERNSRQMQSTQPRSNHLQLPFDVTHWSRCRYCGQNGNSASPCCPARAANNGSYIGSYSSQDSAFTKQICMRCYKTGHQTQDCRASSSQYFSRSSSSQEVGRRYKK